MQDSLRRSTPVPTSDEFTRTLGQFVWLMTLSKDYREKPISFIESHVSTPLMFKQVRVFLREKQPLAAISWAYVSESVKVKLDSDDFIMSLEDWRSGSQVKIVDCISPLVDPEPFRDQFLYEVEAATDRMKNK